MEQDNVAVHRWVRAKALRVIHNADVRCTSATAGSCHRQQGQFLSLAHTSCSSARSGSMEDVTEQAATSIESTVFDSGASLAASGLLT